MRLVSWNVNGIRSVIAKGFWDWLAADGADVVCLQETRIQAHQLSSRMQSPEGYHSYWNHAEPKGYSGVATICQEQPVGVHQGFGQPEFDTEGRVLITEHPSFTLVNAYFPSGQRGHDRVAFKLRFYDALLAFCLGRRDLGESLIVCGDLNTAHQPIDLARPAQNKKTSGFLPEEREALGRWLDAGFVDIFRHLHPKAEEYSWWTYRANARARNIGWRLDYFMISEELLPSVQGAHTLGQVTGSDHCPVALELAP